MRLPTLGYEDDKLISKIEIGIIQIEDAIELFMSEKFVCATTLAGAAEDLFAGALNARGRFHCEALFLKLF